MITECTGDILSETAYAICLPVNCVGVMGKGLALQATQRRPSLVAPYKLACDVGRMHLGSVWVWRNGDILADPAYWIFFPTKHHWRDAARIDVIRAGLMQLVDAVAWRAFESVALPALGCGLGGLAWAHVYPLIHVACARLPDVDWRVYPPQAPV